MQSPVAMTDHPTEETLAAFIDGRLGGEARRAIVEHVVSCAECRDIIMAAQELEAVPPQTKGVDNVVAFPRKRFLGGASAAAAALVVVAFLPPVRAWIVFQRTGGLSSVIAAQGAVKQRAIATRLSGGFPYNELKPSLRGSNDESPLVDDDRLPLLSAAAKLESASRGTSWKKLRAFADAQILLGDRENAETAVRTMERAVALGPKDDPTLLNDLAAVYVERARRQRDPENVRLALESAERAWQVARTPESAWNRAFALELADRDADAVRAWNEYLTLDATSPWAKEARSHIARPKY